MPKVKKTRKKCPHGKRRSDCRECSPSSFCMHDKRRSQCRVCCPASFCEHDKQRSKCIVCSPASFCIHGRQRSRCRECGGSSFCEHRKRRSRCRECSPSSFCEHNRQRSDCTEGSCGLIPSAHKCIGCCSKLVNRVPGVPSSHLCADCRSEYGVAAIKKFEIQMEAWLDEETIHWSYSNKKLPCAPTTRYPDYLVVASTEHVVLIEVDENEHVNYNQQCEITRISEIMDSIDCLNLHVIRFNPNAPGSTDLKRVAVIEAIRTAIGTNFGSLNDTGCVVQYIGYNEDRVAALDQLSCQMQDTGI